MPPVRPTLPVLSRCQVLPRCWLLLMRRVLPRRLRVLGRRRELRRLLRPRRRLLLPKCRAGAILPNSRPDPGCLAACSMITEHDRDMCAACSVNLNVRARLMPLQARLARSSSPAPQPCGRRLHRSRDDGRGASLPTPAGRPQPSNRPLSCTSSPVHPASPVPSCTDVTSRLPAGLRSSGHRDQASMDGDYGVSSSIMRTWPCGAPIVGPASQSSGSVSGAA